MGDRLSTLAVAVETELLEGILPFWLKMQDRVRGGFYGGATSRGRVLPSAPKGAILQARILWTFSTASSRFGDPALLEAARWAYCFIVEHIVDSSEGGIVWSVSADCRERDGKKHLYAHAFVIYGLVAYFRASGDPEALGLAQQIFSAIEAKAVDPSGRGYLESFSPTWGPTPNLDMGRFEAPKTFNTHLHLLEAYGSLWSVWPEPALGRRLSELIGLLTGPMLDRGRNTFFQFFDPEWHSIDQGHSFGHDIEASWLIPSVADLLSPSVANATRKALSGVADAVFQRAVEADGGLKTGLNAAGELDNGKFWWVQAEALVGFLDAFQHQGKTRYLDAAERVWGYIERHLIDRQFGEWRLRIEPSGSPSAIQPKAHFWKCPYHNGRACMEALDRLETLSAQAVPTH